VCHLSPHHTRVTELAAVQERHPDYAYRRYVTPAGSPESDCAQQGLCPKLPGKEDQSIATDLKGFRTREDCMSISTSYRRGLLAAASLAFLIAAAGPGAAQPGFSPMDKTKPAESKQDNNLKPHPTPPIAPSADKLPIDKVKLPAGFKAEVWSSGHPAAAPW
jgi:hypothetical protein